MQLPYTNGNEIIHSKYDDKVKSCHKKRLLIDVEEEIWADNPPCDIHDDDRDKVDYRGKHCKKLTTLRQLYVILEETQ